MAELPDGRQFKLTGYERASVWARRPDMALMQVNVVIVPLRDAEEVARLYDEFEQLLSDDMM